MADAIAATRRARRRDREVAARPLLSRPPRRRTRIDSSRAAEDALARLRALGFSDADARTLFDHFDDAERRGKESHGHSRIAWLETLPDLQPAARPAKIAS